MGLHEEITKKRLRDLTPDRRNPRFPKAMREEVASVDEVFKHLADAFDALALADSIARHGYFASEPMIVTEEDDEWVVLEGNRRLTALYGMARPELRQTFANPGRWEAAANAGAIGLDKEVPVIVADERADADEVIGFRHIGGVLEWSPAQRALFIAHLIDTRGESFEDAAEAVGEEVSVVRLLYRNQAIIAAAEEMEEPEVAARAASRFGIFTTALNRTTLRDFIGAKALGEVEEQAPQLEAERLPRLVELSSWLFGADGEAKVISESRQIKELARVVADEEALAELRLTRNLDSALDIADHVDDPEPGQVLTQLARGVGHLRSAVGSIALIAMEPRALELSEELDELAEEVHDAVRPSQD